MSIVPPSTTTPEQVTRLRICHRTEYEFAVERDIIEDSAAISQYELHRELEQLSDTERRVLESRIKQRIRHANELMDGSRETFSEPYATPSDLDVSFSTNTER